MKMRRLTKAEIAARWLFYEQYAAQSLGVIDWYERLSDYRNGLVAQFMEEYERAPTTGGET